jgi:sugar-specific transcriptional regulator TrmB
LGIENSIGRRRYSVTKRRDEKVTSLRNTNFRKNQRERPNLTERYASNDRRKGNKDDEFLSDSLTIWPKIVEYAGLSEYEAKVYLSLLGLGTAGARRLSLHCHVPRTKVYGTLKKLIDYGLVVEIPGAPKSFAPSSPEDAFSAVLNIVKKKAVDFTTIVESLTETHELIKSDTSPQQKVVWYLNEGDDIMGKCHEMIGQSKESLEVLTSDQLQEQGVDIWLYSPLDPMVNPLARELSYLFAVEKVEVETPILFIKSDMRRFIIAELDEQLNNSHLISAVFSDDPALLSLITLLLNDGKKGAILKPLSL